MTPGAFQRRPGSMSLMMLLAIPSLLLFVGMVLYVGMLRDAKTESQNGADAAALAAAHELATDDLLTQNRARAEGRIQRRPQGSTGTG